MTRTSLCATNMLKKPNHSFPHRVYTTVKMPHNKLNLVLDELVLMQRRNLEKRDAEGWQKGVAQGSEGHWHVREIC